MFLRLNHLSYAALLGVCILVSGCTTAVHLRNEMEDSKTAYKTCLDNNPNNVKACEKERLQFEADVKAYESIKHM